MSIETGGILGLILLVLAIYAMIKTVQSNAGTGTKVFWIVIILLLPFVGLIAWFLLGPKGR